MEGVKHGVDLVAVGAVVASWMHVLPEILAAVASALSIIWYVIRIADWWRAQK